MFETTNVANGGGGVSRKTTISVLVVPLAGFLTATMSARPSLVTSATTMPAEFCTAMGVGPATGGAKYRDWTGSL